MNKYQTWLIISLILLAAAFVMPIYVLYNALGKTLQDVSTNLTNYPSGLGGFLQAQQAAQQQLIATVVIVEAILVAVFAATFWYAIKCRDQCRSFPPAS